MLERSIVVRCSLAAAFEAFTTHIDEWWPRSHRRWSDSVLVLEGRAGGRLYERSAVGEEASLGAVTHWEPPARLGYDWYPGSGVDVPTHVDVRFFVDGDRTRVEVTHSLGKVARELWTERVARFEQGWGAVLPAFAGHVETMERGNSG